MVRQFVVDRQSWQRLVVCKDRIAQGSPVQEVVKFDVISSCDNLCIHHTAPLGKITNEKDINQRNEVVE
ncbi:hypothetical protein J6590_028855 [Homalodisca vitripennis]|nr:hypothetical protein J6590_028855 [Homalodisca vitripennis]